ncbi:MAG TPA: cysteine desulfurase family protein [Rhizomicrobium sp.]|nr:cysteine desulfurase family protein [Rhizomicrobium sp.]
MTYLDHNATSPLRPEAQAAVARALSIGGNASSVHAQGRAARAMVEEAREVVAKLAGAKPSEVIFTGGGTESNWLALNGAIQGAADAEARITRLFVSSIEHDSVTANAVALAERVPGLRMELIPVSADGVIDTRSLFEMLREGKGRALVAAMAANNETGVIQPIGEIRRISKEANALLFSDVVQAAGKIALPDADYLTFSAHKLGAPQGIGALIVKEGAPFAPQILGGGQEKSRRAGTENVSGIAGFGAVASLGLDNKRIADLRDRFERELKLAVSDVVIFGANAPRLANTSNFALPGIAAETAVMALDLDGVMLSSGAACSSGKVRPSAVLKAMGVPDEIAKCALRVSFGWNSADADVDAAIAAIARLVARARSRRAA